MFNKPNPKQDFYELEQEVLKFWIENDILNKSIYSRPEDNAKTFYDGPITANGEPHLGHSLTFSLKDIFPRYWSMKGFRVARSLGWDCHGIPVEYEVEKKLGFKEKKDIEKYGIAEFNKLCRESVEKYRERIIELEQKMGRLTNDEEEYATMDSKFIESVWWSLKELYEKGLLYEGFKVVPYSTRAGTTLSNAEVALGGYQPFVDPAITVEFPLVDEDGTRILAWTTTPWTMPGNLGLAVGEEIEYVKVKVKGKDWNYVVAKDRAKEVFKDQQFEILETFRGSELVGKKYNPPFKYYVGHANAHQIYLGDFVATDSGTGIVHLAPYGAEDNELFQKNNIKNFDYLDEQGDFTNDIPEYAGKNYRDANELIIEELKKNNVLFEKEDYEHEMPMCWRTKTPLIYKPITSWYVAVSKMRDELVENNNKINWIPAHAREGRFGNWLAEIKDWGISRKRYWGTPLPIWKSESGKVIFIGSFEELKKYSGAEITDPHRPFIDEVSFEYEGETYTRISDVIDVWYDSGAMPFARLHYPFENKEKFEKKFPAQYIAEGIDQTRGWFYSLHAIATTLFNSNAFENVIINGTIVDAQKRKLSKSLGNYTPPFQLIENFGADTLRINFFDTPLMYGEDTTADDKTFKSYKQEVILPLWNIYSYFVTYANIHEWKPSEELVYNERKVLNDSHPWDHIPFDDIENNLDAWILVKLQFAIKNINKELGEYQIPKATSELKELINEISKWYIRTNRDRFVNGDRDALSTLYYVLIETLKLAAPFMPFTTEHIYRNLVVEHLENQKESIHLCDYPEADENFISEYENILSEMQVVRDVTEMGHAQRAEKGIKVRQILSDLKVESSNSEVSEFSQWMRELIAKEINVQEVSNAFKLEVNEDYAVSENTKLGLKVALNTKITEELKAEGILRELVRNVQAERKNMKLEIGDKITLQYKTTENLDSIIKKFEDKFKESIKAIKLENKESLENPISFDMEGDKFEFIIEK